MPSAMLFWSPWTGRCPPSPDPPVQYVLTCHPSHAGSGHTERWALALCGTTAQTAQCLVSGVFLGRSPAHLGPDLFQGNNSPGARAVSSCIACGARAAGPMRLLCTLLGHKLRHNSHRWLRSGVREGVALLRDPASLPERAEGSAKSWLPYRGLDPGSTPELGHPSTQSPLEGPWASPCLRTSKQRLGQDAQKRSRGAHLLGWKRSALCRARAGREQTQCPR